MRGLCRRACLAFRSSLPSRSTAFPGMAERASLHVASEEPTLPTLSRSAHDQGVGLEAPSPMPDFSKPVETLHTDAENKEKHDEADQSNRSPLRDQSGDTLASATSTSEREGHPSRRRDDGEVVRFQLKNSCVLALQRGDITKWSIDGQTDGIVNAANTRMLGGGGVDGAIHRAAGPRLYEACLKLPLVGKGIRCQTGDAVITKGFSLPVSTIVHSVGPVYMDSETSEPLLESSYKSSLRLAVRNGLKYLAFPAISCGIYGYPYDEAAEIALNTVNEHSEELKEVHFVLFEEGSWRQWLSKAGRSFERLE